MKHHDTVDHAFRATSFGDFLVWVLCLIDSTYVLIWHVVINGKRPHQDWLQYWRREAKRSEPKRPENVERMRAFLHKKLTGAIR